MFKVGDKVRRISHIHVGMNIGDIGTITKMVGEYNFQLKEFPCYNSFGNHAGMNFELVKENEMKPHKYAELIKAWADGVIIQSMEPNIKVWQDEHNPSWAGWKEYRIKPEPKPDVIVVDCFKLGNNDSTRFYALRDNNIGTPIKFTFDAETGKLKAVEMLENE